MPAISEAEAAERLAKGVETPMQATFQKSIPNSSRKDPRQLPRLPATWPSMSGTDLSRKKSSTSGTSCSRKIATSGTTKNRR